MPTAPMRGSAPANWMVVEADESDGTFLKLPTDVAIVTNVDPEHLDHFKTFDAVQDAFRSFVENVPFSGFAVMSSITRSCRRIVGKIETAASPPMARIRRPTRAGRSRPAAAAQRFTVVFRNRKTDAAHEIAELSGCRCRAATAPSTPPRQPVAATLSDDSSPTRSRLSQRERFRDR